MKKLRVDDFPSVIDLTFKIDEDDGFIVNIEQAFAI